MKPFWKNTRKGKSKKHSKTSGKKLKAQVCSRPMEEPWKPPIPMPKTGIIAPDIVEKQLNAYSTLLVNEPKQDTFYKEFKSKFRQLLSDKRRPFDVWRDFIIMSACAMSNSVDRAHYNEREKRYLEAINKYENLISIYSQNYMPML